MTRRLTFLSLLLLASCADIKLEPADDQWDRPQEAMPGIVTGDRGEYEIHLGKGASAQPSSGFSSPSHGHADYDEFRQWQAWRKARHDHSADYQEFLQWLEFNKAKARAQ